MADVVMGTGLVVALIGASALVLMDVGYWRSARYLWYFGIVWLVIVPLAVGRVLGIYDEWSDLLAGTFQVVVFGYPMAAIYLLPAGVVYRLFRGHWPDQKPRIDQRPGFPVLPAGPN